MSTFTVTNRDPGHAPGWGHTPLHRALNAEWTRAWAGRQAKPPAAWAEDAHLWPFRWVGDVLSVLDSPATKQREADAILASLCIRASAGDSAAARVAVQHLVPCAIGLVRRSDLRGRSMLDVLDDLLSYLWLAVASGETGPSDRQVALRLLRKAEYQVLIGPYRRTRKEPPFDPGRVWGRRGPVCDLAGRPEASPRSAGEDLAEAIEQAVERGLPADDAILLRLAYVDGHSTPAIGRAMGIPLRTLRWRKARARRNLRELASM